MVDFVGENLFLCPQIWALDIYIYIYVYISIHSCIHDPNLARLRVMKVYPLVDFPIKPSIYKGFSIAMLDNQMVPHFSISNFWH